MKLSIKRKCSESSGYESAKRPKLTFDRDNRSKHRLRSQVIPNPILSQSLGFCGTKEKRSHVSTGNHAKERIKIDKAPEVGTVVEQRYRINKFLGKGSFGFVCECTDLRVEKLNVAIKFFKCLNDDKATLREIDILRKIADEDVEGSFHCIQPMDLFRDSVSKQDCLVFPLYSCNLYNWFKENNFHPFTIDETRIIMKQICRAMAFIHSFDIVHTDFKPENIMIVDNKLSHDGHLRSLSIKVIDFGMSVEGKELHRHHCQTRHYRAPEVLLEQHWSFGIDVWSVGCILYELLTGDTIFMPNNVKEHLFLIEQFLGDIPLCVVDRCSHNIRKSYFHRDGALRKTRFDGDVFVLRDLRHKHRRKYECVVDLIEKMMRVDSAKRITATEALAHRFFIDP